MDEICIACENPRPPRSRKYCATCAAEARVVATHRKRRAIWRILAEGLAPEIFSAARLRRNAYHEAGHGVVAYALGMPILSLSIPPDFAGPKAGDDGARYRVGVAVSRWPGHKPSRDAEALYSAGGPAGERLACGDFDRAGAASDLRELERAALLRLRDTPGAEGPWDTRDELDVAITTAVESITDGFVARAELVLRENRVALDAVASALVERREIFRTYFEHLCRHEAHPADP